MIKLSEHFSLEGDAMLEAWPIGTLMACHNLHQAECLRARLNYRLAPFENGEVALRITDSLRTPVENDLLIAKYGDYAAGGRVSRDSQHLLKNHYNALDIVAYYKDTGEPIPVDVVADACEGLFDMVKKYDDGHIHVDQRDKVKKLKEELEDG